MKYSLDINIICNDQAVLDLIVTKLPEVTDPRVWPDEYQAPVIEADGVTGDLTLSATIRLKEEADRDSIEDDILNIAEVLTLCEVGARVALHTCDHDLGEGRTGCVESVVYEVV